MTDEYRLARRRYLQVMAALPVLGFGSSNCGFDTEEFEYLASERSILLAREAFPYISGTSHQTSIGFSKINLDEVAKRMKAFLLAIDAGAGTGSASSPIEFGATVVRLCQSDFYAGRTILVNGWTLSETEVFLCAYLNFTTDP